MRQIVLDTETTGLELTLGHRVIEIGCVELINRRHSGRTFHRYLNPERDIDAGAQAVHGLSRERLAGEPKFADVALELLEFVHGGELIIHNSAFDIAFLDMELARLSKAGVASLPESLRTICRVLDTLSMARERHPGQRNNLDALCKRYGIDNTHRELHGALLDARILADVFLAMTGGQSMLALDQAARDRASPSQVAVLQAVVRPVEPLVVIHANEEELAAHASLVALLQKKSAGRCVWSQLEAASSAAGLSAAELPRAS